MALGLKVSDIIAITGHRDYPDPGALYRGLDNLRAREYVFGGARGVDSRALEHMAKTQPGAVRTVVVPNRVANQPAAARVMIRRHATKVVELRNQGMNRYRLRNEYMVRRSTHVRAFYDFRGRGGTYNTINYSRRIGKSFDVWPMNKFDQAAIMKKSPAEFKGWVNDMRRHRVNLKCIKGLILNFILRVLHIPLQEFFTFMGVTGVRTLEQFFNM